MHGPGFPILTGDCDYVKMGKVEFEHAACAPLLSRRWKMKKLTELLSCVPEAEPPSRRGSIEQRLASAQTLYDYEIRWRLNGQYNGLVKYDVISTLALSRPEYLDR
jgi:hypothetical protein